MGNQLHLLFCLLPSLELLVLTEVKYLVSEFGCWYEALVTEAQTCDLLVQAASWLLFVRASMPGWPYVSAANALVWRIDEDSAKTVHFCQPVPAGLVLDSRVTMCHVHHPPLHTAATSRHRLTTHLQVGCLLITDCAPCLSPLLRAQVLDEADMLLDMSFKHIMEQGGLPERGHRVTRMFRSVGFRVLLLGCKGQVGLFAMV